MTLAGLHLVRMLQALLYTTLLDDAPITIPSAKAVVLAGAQTAMEPGTYNVILLLRCANNVAINSAADIELMSITNNNAPIVTQQLLCSPGTVAVEFADVQIATQQDVCLCWKSAATIDVERRQVIFVKHKS